MEHLLIIGGVAAGATAAAKARRLSPDASITLLEAGPDISFANCGLPYYIAGDIPHRSSLILQSPLSFKQQYDVDVHVNTAAQSIDTARRVVAARNAETGEVREFPYTKLILAQGGRPIAPDLPGAKLDHVFTLWTLDDMDRIDAHIKRHAPTSAVIAGGGFIGLEMAEALAKRGLEVHVVEKMPHVMAIMDPEISGFVEAELAAHGVVLHKNVGVTEIGKDAVKLEDGSAIEAGMVLLSIGVRPTLQLAKDAGLAIGPAGGLLVDETLRTSDPHIWAAGDMVEIEHRVTHAKVRIPLAGPANRQGRIAAENALGGNHPYHGSLGTSIVRVFEAVAGTTGLSLKAARAAGLDAESITVHKEHHTSYYPGSKPVTVKLVYERGTGRILGGQTAGYAGADRRLDVIATAAFSGMTVHELADVDFAYSPPLGTANDALNMAAFVAQNRLSGYGPSLSVDELDAWVAARDPVVLDVRDPFAFEKSHVAGALNIPLEVLPEQVGRLPAGRAVLVYDETGKKGHQAARFLIGARGGQILNTSGGHQSMQRHQRALGFAKLELPLLPVAAKGLEKAEAVAPTEAPAPVAKAPVSEGPLVVDVRTPGEFAGGAYPGALNIPLDEVPNRLAEFGAKDREIVVYCASGARSGYAARILAQAGFAKVANGGGVAQMMRRGR
jgi:NADPH-dependent 2,4-dienoyl-CoA reductase/sulfur reductase-like enzyme/rhodanese-related sulfurtransferase